MTALGVYRGMLACAEKAFGQKSLKGLHIALQGLGAVNYYLLKYLHQEGARVSACDINPEAENRAKKEYQVQIVNPETIYDTACDIFSPGALGAIINPQTIPRLKCKVIAGAANNQLATEKDGEDLLKRGILYAPDYAINAGGVINICYERDGYDLKKATAHVDKIYDTIKNILQVSESDRQPTNLVANRIAENRVREAERARR
jgi:leucine dehydrogenase